MRTPPKAASLRILTERREALEEIAQTLIQNESIDAGELQAILDRHPHEIRPVALLAPRE